MVVVQRVFYYHPSASISLYANSMEASKFDHFAAKGYSISIRPIDDKLFLGTVLWPWWVEHKVAAHNVSMGLPVSAGEFFYSHLTDALRLAVLWQHGGVYIDFDVLVLRYMGNFRNALGAQKPGGYAKFNLAVAAFDKHHPFLGWLQYHFVKSYDPKCWDCVGPKLVEENLLTYSAIDPSYVVYQNTSIPASMVDGDTDMTFIVNVYPPETFYPSGWFEAKNDTFLKASGYSQSQHADLLRHSATYHMWTKMSVGSKFERGSLLARLLNPHEDHSVRISAVHVPSGDGDNI